MNALCNWVGTGCLSHLSALPSVVNLLPLCVLSTVLMGKKVLMGGYIFAL